MPSFKAHLTNFALKRMFKPQIARLVNDLDGLPENIIPFRAALEKQAAKTRLPKDVDIQPWDITGPQSEVVTPNNAQPDWALLYLHGGGYKFCSPQTHRALTCKLAQTLPARTFVPNYRLAPEHRFPAALDDAMAAYLRLLEDGFDPSRIALAGDSAGGNLCLSLLLKLRETRQPLPAAVALMSPLTDMTNSGLSAKLNSDSDVMFPGEAFAQRDHFYLGEIDARDPLVSPLFGDLSGLPPMLIHASTSECLLDDSTRFTARAQAQGASVELQLFDGLPHVWHYYCGQMPEADRDATRLALFLRARLQLGAIR
ncbi:alpha/beta hydrolase [Ruegeria halocynthiae]|uniref:alpha/beta hydrolase n=1 Tax=Ruegeria halocynthiae TaxID=985054 RepID=UPI00055B473E|nr:alpha/beta hydrolase [Ruegeria halocynthiae]